MKRVLSILKKPFKWLRKHWKLTIVLLIIIAIVGFIVYRRHQAANKPLTYVQPQYRDLVKTLDVSGVVDANQDASMHFAAGGKLTYLGAQEGATVKKGQLIAQVDQSALQNQLQQNLDAYTRDRLDYDLTQKENKDAAPTDQLNTSKQTDQLTLNDTVLNVQLQDISIQNTKLFAPFNGVLVSTPATVTGVNLAATDNFELVDPSTLIFEGGVDESDISQVQVGQPATVTLDAYRDTPIQTQVNFISYKSQETNSNTNVYLVKFPLVGDASLINKYRLGMNGDVSITLATKNHALSVPIDATRQDANGNTFVDIKDGTNPKEARQIQPGIETDDYVEVLSGLTPNDQVVLPQTATDTSSTTSP